MSTVTVQQNTGRVDQYVATEIEGVENESLTAKVFSEGSIDNPADAKKLAEDLLDLNVESPFLTEQQVEQIQSVVSGMGGSEIGGQLMALASLVAVLIKIHPGGSLVQGVTSEDLKTLGETVSPLANNYREFLEASLNQSSPAVLLNELQNFSNSLLSLVPGAADQLGLSGPEIETLAAEVFSLVKSYKILLNTESAALVSDGNSWESFVVTVQDLKVAMQGMGLNLEGSAIDSFLSQYGSAESINKIGQLDLWEQRSVVVSFRSELLKEIEDKGVAEVFVPKGLSAAQRQVSIEENIYAVSEMIEQDEYREYLTDAKSVLMTDGGFLAGATAEDFQLYKSNLQAMSDRRCAELGIPADPAYRTPAQNELAETDILLGMVDGSMAWADKWKAEASSGRLTKHDAMSASIELIALDASTFKAIELYLAETHGTDSVICQMVFQWFEKASQILLTVKNVLKTAST